MNENLTKKEKAMEVAKEILIASIQSNDKIFFDKRYAEEFAAALEIIYNKVIELI